MSKLPSPSQALSSCPKGSPSPQRTREGSPLPHAQLRQERGQWGARGCSTSEEHGVGASVSLLQPPTCLLPQSWGEDSEALMSLFFFLPDVLFLALRSRKLVFSTLLCFSSTTLPCAVLADACPVAAHRTSVFLFLRLSAFTNADLRASAPDEESLLHFWPCTERSPAPQLQQSRICDPVAAWHLPAPKPASALPLLGAKSSTGSLSRFQMLIKLMQPRAGTLLPV